MASDEAYIAAAMRKGLFIARSRDVYTHVGIKSGGDFAAIEITDEEAEAEQRHIDARATVTDTAIRDGVTILEAWLQGKESGVRIYYFEDVVRDIIVAALAALAAQNVEAQ